MSKEKILVTGGAGFIGSHLVDQLLAAGYAVRILDNLSRPTHDGIPKWLAKDAEFIHGDVRNPSDVDKALEEVDGVFHLAVTGGFSADIEPIVRSNSCGTAVLMERIGRVKNRVQRIVVASSVAVYGEGAYRCAQHGLVFPGLRDRQALTQGQWEQRCPSCDAPVAVAPIAESKPVHPQTVYAITKYDQERTVLCKARDLGVHGVALRYFLTFGPRQSLLNPYTGVCSIFSSQLANDKPPRIFEDGNQLRDFVFVQDVARANLLVYQDSRANGKAFNVGTGQAVRIRDVARILADLLGKKIEPLIEGEFRPGEFRHLAADIGALKSLGFKPSVSIRDGLERFVQWVFTQGNIADYFAQAYTALRGTGVIHRAKVGVAR